MLPSEVGRGRGRVPDIPRLPRRDIAAALVVSAGALLAPITGGQGVAAAGGWWGALAVAAALGQGIPLAWRSTRPVAVGGIVLASYAASALIVGLTPPLGPWIVIWSTGTAPEPDPGKPPASPWRSPAVQTWGAAVLTCFMILAAELAHSGSGASVLFLLITALVVTASWTVRADRARVAAVRDKGAADERLRLARELHDVVGHGLGVVAIQTSNARLALQRGDSAKASTAIGLAEASSRTAMREMRQMLGVLTEAPDGQPVVSLPGIADIGELVQGVRDTGTPVDWVSAGSWDHVPAAVQLCAFRVVQEGLTNVMKHAPGSHVVVEVGIRSGQLVATVTSSGSGNRPDESAGGLGLAGLRARVDGLGGQLTAGPKGTGWAVEAVLPFSAGPR